MSRLLFSIQAFIIHFIKREDEHSLHSPFLFDFYTKTVKRKKEYISIVLETERINIFSIKDKIDTHQLGAKTRSTKKSNTIGGIAQKSLSSTEQAAFLTSVVDYMQPKNILEIGTSFGITTCYLAQNAPNAALVTLEGNQAIAALAAERFSRLNLQNITVIKGNFDHTLQEAIAILPSIDFVFFDGNHQYEPTKRYFEWCLAKSTHQSTFVFHDIYWSKDMAKAWNEIRNHPSVYLSVDLFYFGIIFFRNNQPKQHFILKF